MNISAIKCTPIKPQVSFKSDNEDKEQYSKILELTSKMNSSVVDAGDVKDPISAGTAIGLAALLSFATGKNVASFISTFAKNTPAVVDNTLRTVSNRAKDISGTLISSNTGKFVKAKNLTGKVLGKAEQISRQAYKKLAYVGVPADANIAKRQAKAFQNIVGWASLSTLFPAICRVDSNKDGVSDLMQRSQNAYTGAKNNLGKTIEQTSNMTTLMELVM